MTPGDAARAAVDPVVEVYKRDVDRTLFDRNLRLTPSERIEQLQRVVSDLCEMQRTARSTRAAGHDRVG